MPPKKCYFFNIILYTLLLFHRDFLLKIMIKKLNFFDNEPFFQKTWIWVSYIQKTSLVFFINFRAALISTLKMPHFQIWTTKTFLGYPFSARKYSYLCKMSDVHRMHVFGVSRIALKMTNFIPPRSCGIFHRLRLIMRCSARVQILAVIPSGFWCMHHLAFYGPSLCLWFQFFAVLLKINTCFSCKNVRGKTFVDLFE